MKAWAFTILRNQFLSGKRREWRSQPLDQTVAENTLVANDDRSCAEELLDVRNAMQMLPLDQREALILVAAAGLTYDETARIVGSRDRDRKKQGEPGPRRARACAEEGPGGKAPQIGHASTDVFGDIMQTAVNLANRMDAS